MKQETLKLLFFYNKGKLYWKPRPLEAFKKYSAYVAWASSKVSLCCKKTTALVFPASLLDIEEVYLGDYGE